MELLQLLRKLSANHSIERTRSGLRPPRVAHVKRWGATVQSLLRWGTTMQRIALVLTFIAVAVLTSVGTAFADVTTPASNLAGVKQIQERIDVSLNLKGADEFAVEANEVIKIVRSALSVSGISLAKGDYKIPSVHVAITGESAGGGGAEFTVEIVVRALISSPFAKDRSIEAIIWRNSATGHHLMRYDPASKGLVKPSGTMKDRVYDTVREVAARLAADAKVAGK